MKLTAKIIRDVKAACREECGGRRLVELGFFSWDGMASDNEGANFLLYGEGADLFESLAIDTMKGVDIPGFGKGYVALDLYCYTTGEDGELDTNVYVLLNPQGDIVWTGSVGNTPSPFKEINLILAAAGHQTYVPN